MSSPFVSSDIPKSPKAFLKLYGAPALLDDIRRHYSEDDADRMRLHLSEMIENIRVTARMNPEQAEKIFDQAKKALTFDLHQQHRYFVQAESHQERLNVYTECAWYSKANRLIDHAKTKVVKHLSDHAIEEGFGMIAAGVVILVAGMPLVGGVALAAGIKVGAKALIISANAEDKVETAEKLMASIDSPLALQDIMKNPDSMPLRAPEKEQQKLLLASKQYQAMSSDEQAKAISLIHRSGSARLAITLHQMPTTVKAGLYLEDIRFLCDVADRFDQEFVGKLAESMKDNKEALEGARPFQREQMKARISRDTSRELARSVVWDASVERNKRLGFLVASNINDDNVKAVEDASVNAYHAVRDGFEGVKHSIKDKLAQRRASRPSEIPVASPASPAP